MAYKSICCVNWIHALVVRGGLSDLQSVLKLRPEMKEAWAPHFIQTVEEYENRSVTCWPEKLPKNVPILLLHGLCDWRVSPVDSLNLSRMFLEHKIPHRLVCFENAGHALAEVSHDAWNMIFEWFERFLLKNEPPPKVGETENSR
jgi:pimeloyl-ACP methyl ester carboxylesterase